MMIFLTALALKILNKRIRKNIKLNLMKPHQKNIRHLTQLMHSRKIREKTQQLLKIKLLRMQ